MREVGRPYPVFKNIVRIGSRTVGLVLRYFVPSVSWPYNTILVKPPECKIRWDVVYGLEDGRDPVGAAVKSLVAMYSNIAPPKEAQCY
mgnify:CR=1 FL=1